MADQTQPSVEVTEDEAATRSVATLDGASEVARLIGELQDKTINARGKLERLTELTSLGAGPGATLLAMIPAETALALLGPGADAGAAGASPVELASLAFVATLRVLLVDPIRAIRAATLRTFRYFATDPSVVRAMFDGRAHLFVTMSLERNQNQHEIERMQALKLIRAVMNVDAMLVPHNVVVAMVAIAENHEDPFCRAVLETICEIAVRNPHVTCLAGGLKLLFSTVLDPFFGDIVEPLTVALMYLMNSPASRAFVRPSLDVGILLSPLSDTYIEADAQSEHKLDASKRCLTTMLRSWPGLMILADNDVTGIRSVVAALSIDSPDIRNAVFDVLFSVFGIEPPPDPSSVSGRSRRRRKVSDSLLINVEDLVVGDPGQNLLTCFVALLLTTFRRAGLFDALVELGMSSLVDVAHLSKYLLSELLQLSNSLLPRWTCADLQSLPSLVERAASYDNRHDDGQRSRANALLATLNRVAGVKSASSSAFQDFHLRILVTNTNRARRVKGTDSSQAFTQLERIKVQMYARLDEPSFQVLLRETNILGTKNHAEWNWELVLEMIEGPLSDPVRLRETMSKTKFIKRILSFLRPKRHEFADLEFSKENIKYIETACELLNLLMTCDEGAAYLQDNELLGQIAEFCEYEVKQDSRKGERFLDQDRLANTMTREYFTMVGTLASTKRGQECLEEHSIFKLLYPLIALPGREDMAYLIISSLDYNRGGHVRVLLAKCMTARNSLPIRLHATRHMRGLLRVGVCDFEDWGIDLLVTQLNDSSDDVVQEAFATLSEACDDTAVLQALITKRPQLGSVGKNILTRFLASVDGFNYLADSDWISVQMAHWMDEGNVTYVKVVEVALAEAMSEFLYDRGGRAPSVGDPGGRGAVRANTLSPTPSTSSAAGATAAATTRVDTRARFVAIPTHFFGELAKTDQGCDLLRDSGHFDTIFGVLTDDGASLLDRKAALWAVAQIGSSNTGAAFLYDVDAHDYIGWLAESANDLSFRGTAFYALCLLSKASEAHDRLTELGWESTATGICVPSSAKALSSFFSFSSASYVGSWPDSPLSDITLPSPPAAAPSTGNDDAEEDMETREAILKHLGQLSNHIQSDSALHTLVRLKRTEGEAFTDLSLFCEVLHMLCVYKFRPKARRFIYDVFDGLPLNTPAAIATLDGCEYLDAVMAPTVGFGQFRREMRTYSTSSQQAAPGVSGRSLSDGGSKKTGVGRSGRSPSAAPAVRSAAGVRPSTRSSTVVGRGGAAAGVLRTQTTAKKPDSKDGPRRGGRALSFLRRNKNSGGN